MKSLRWVPVFILAGCCFALAQRQKKEVTQEDIKQPTADEHLYTAVDPTATGGIKGEIASPSKPLIGAYALPPDQPEKVYKGMILGDRSEFFLFNNLPVSKYDLVLVFNNQMYEGLRLNRGDNTLVKEDYELIKSIIDRSEPFFNKKIIHRAEGKTGDGELSRCIATYLRDKPMKMAWGGPSYVGSRRAFKLVLLKDVGPGWQVTKTRIFMQRQVVEAEGEVKHEYKDYLGNLRVVDDLVDLGKIDLAK